MNQGPACATWSATARRTGIAAALSLFVLLAAYAVALVLGLLALPDAASPIADPWFTAMEVLILAVAPLVVLLVAAIQAFAPVDRKIHAAAAVAFAAATSVLTAAVHATVLAFGPEAAAEHPWLLSFRWPSVVYVVDVLAWDGFFALAAVFAALALPSKGPASWARALLFASGLLSMAGLLGAIAGDMSIRNIGIIGYGAIFPAATIALAFVFHRTPPDAAPSG